MSDTTLRRFLDHAHAAIEHGALTDEDGGPSNLANLRRAIPIARSIVLFGDPLDFVNETLEAYIRAECAAVAAEPENPIDPDHECDLAAAQQTATYFVALAVGLLVADLVQAGEASVAEAGGGR